MSLPGRLFALTVICCLLAGAGDPPPPPVVGHPTLLKEGLPVYDPFTTIPARAVVTTAPVLPKGPTEALFSGDLTPVRIRISQREWDGLLRDFQASNNRSGIQRQVQVTVGDSLVGQVGLSVMGRGSLKLPQADGSLQRANYMLDFGADFAGDEARFGSDSLPTVPGNRGRRVFGLPRMILKANDRDATYLRPQLVAAMMIGFGVPTPRLGYAALTLEIEDRAPVGLGVYALHEFVDHAWFQTVLGDVSCVFDLGKGDQGYGYLDVPDPADEADREAWCDQGLIGRPIRDERDPRWRGQAFDPAYTWVDGNDDCSECQEHLNGLILALQDDTLSASDLAELVDVDRMLRYMTISAFSGNVDDFWIFGNNVFLCRVQQDNGWRWTPVPIDFDLTFNEEFDSKRNPTGTVLHYGVGSALGGKILSYEVYRAHYRDLVLAWLQILATHSIADLGGELVAVFQPGLERCEVEDPFPFTESALQDLLGFAADKAATAAAELEIK